MKIENLQNGQEKNGEKNHTHLHMRKQGKII